MSADIHFAAAVSVSDTVSVGRPRAARKSLMRPTRSCSTESSVAALLGALHSPSTMATASMGVRTKLNQRKNPLPFLVVDPQGNDSVTEVADPRARSVDPDLIRSGRSVARCGGYFAR